MSISIDPHYDCEDSSSQTFQGNKVVREYTKSWRAIGTASESSFAVRTSAAVLTVAGLTHPEDITARLVGLDAVKEKSAKAGVVRTYIVTASYSSDREKGNRSPLFPDSPAVVSYAWEERLIPVTEDLDGEAIVNTVGDPFDPPLEINVPIFVITIRVGLDPATMAGFLSPAYSRAVNDATFFGWDEGKALLRECKGDPAIYTDDDEIEHDYFDATIQIAFDPLGYNPVKVLNAGYNEFSGEEDEKIRILLPGDGTETSTPQPLDESGHALFGDDVETGKHFLEFNLYNAVDFSVFSAFLP